MRHRVNGSEPGVSPLLAPSTRLMDWPIRTQDYSIFSQWEVGPTALSRESLLSPGFLLAPNGLNNRNPGLFSHEPIRAPAHGQEPWVHGAQKPGLSLFSAQERSDTIFAWLFTFPPMRDHWELNISTGVSFQSLFKSRQQVKFTRTVLHFPIDYLFLVSVSFTFSIIFFYLLRLKICWVWNSIKRAMLKLIVKFILSFSHLRFSCSRFWL